MKFGDFTGLAENYSKYRPGYSNTVLQSVIEKCPVESGEIEAADVGAGTGILTRLLAGFGLKGVSAVEPNADMRNCGERDSESLPIRWFEGSGENTGLESDSCHLLTMASCFHWMDFDKTVAEISRVLKLGGRFCALWNPRYLDDSPLLLEIEAELKKLRPEMKRKSTGNSEFTKTLDNRLVNCGYFDDLLYLEAKHTKRFSIEEYIGVWRSVNDIRVQLGEDKFQEFMNFVESKVASLEHIDAVYRTKAWLVRKKG